ncbi:MAG: SDR family oxidoreductase [Polyangiales bacterium]
MVLITGICGRLGQLLARQLHRRTEVIGVDRRPFGACPKDVVHHAIDLRRKRTRDLFRKGNIKAVVHLGVMHNPRLSDAEHHAWNIVAFQKLLDCVAQYQVPKLVVLSSANVYGPHPDNPQFLTEEAPLLGAQSFGGMRDLVELDMLAQSFFWRHPGTSTVILRPCHILGRVRNAASNYLRLQRPVMVLGFDPMIQVIHERDIITAFERALRPDVRGIYNLRGPGEMPLSHALSLLGRRPQHMPPLFSRSVLERLWKWHLLSFPPPELEHLRFACMVDDSRARGALPFAPHYDFVETLRAVEALR